MDRENILLIVFIVIFSSFWGFMIIWGIIHIIKTALHQFNYMNTGGDGRLSSIILLKRGPSKEIREFSKRTVSNIRNNYGVNGNNNNADKFYRHYTLYSDNAVIEMTYEGYFKPYIELKVIAR